MEAISKKSMNKMRQEIQTKLLKRQKLGKEGGRMNERRIVHQR